MFMTKCEGEIWKLRERGCRSKKRPGTDLGQYASQKARSNHPKLLNSVLKVEIH